MATLRAVVFDAVGTLVTPDPPAGEAYFHAGRRHGSRQPKEEVARRFSAAFRATMRLGSGDPHRTDEPTEAAFWRSVVSNVFEELPAAAIEACFQGLFDHFARPEAWRVYSDVDATLRGLHDHGLIVAVASNFDSRLHSVFTGHRALAAVGRRFVSSEIGWRKPDRRFFGTVCDELGCRPDQVLYVGDDPEIDMAAAIAAGLKSKLLRRSGTADTNILTDLRELIPRYEQTLAPTTAG